MGGGRRKKTRQHSNIKRTKKGRICTKDQDGTTTEVGRKLRDLTGNQVLKMYPRGGDQLCQILLIGQVRVGPGTDRGEGGVMDDTDSMHEGKSPVEVVLGENRRRIGETEHTSREGKKWVIAGVGSTRDNGMVAKE